MTDGPKYPPKAPPLPSDYCQFEQRPGSVCGATASVTPLGIRCGMHGTAFDPPTEIMARDEEQKALLLSRIAGDPINHPPHYARLDPEPIEVIEAWGWDRDAYLSSALKYMSRAGHKDPATEAQDLRKAIWWLSRKADRLEGKA